MLNPGDFYTMTDTLQDPRPSLGRPKATAGLGTTPRPGGMQHRACGKQVVEARGIDFEHMPPKEGPMEQHVLGQEKERYSYFETRAALAVP